MHCDTFTNTYHIYIDKRFQLFYFRSEFSDEFYVCIFVDSRLVDNVLRAISVSKSTESVVVIAFRRTDSRYHDGLRVAAQGIFQQPCKHAITIRNKDIAFRGGHVAVGRTKLGECGYHSA